MKPIVEKVLKSGLVDKHMIQLLERWGNLPEGTSDLVNDESLRNATKLQLKKLAEEIGDEVERERTLKETFLDLDKLRWPAEVEIYCKGSNGVSNVHPGKLQAVMDRFGRYYFRIQDSKKEWFTPGYRLVRDRRFSAIPDDEIVLEVETLYVGEEPVCYQVTTTPFRTLNEEAQK